MQYIVGTDIRIGHPLPREPTLPIEYAGEFVTVAEVRGYLSHPR